MEILASVRCFQAQPQTSPPLSSAFPEGVATAVTIGNFDGCHRGHQALIAETRRLKQKNKWQSVALTFSPRPEAFFCGLETDALLFTPAQKLRAFAELGLDGVCVQEFNLEFSQLSREAFYSEVLRRYLRARWVVVGDNFHFGNRRQGTPVWLQQTMRAEEGLGVSIVPPVMHGLQPVSSTRIRSSLQQGDIAAVTAMLGRPYLLEGVVNRGAQLGRSLASPTLNLGAYTQLVPHTGVYAGYVWLQGLCPGALPSVTALPAGVLPAAISVSRRPTFAELGGGLSIEAHVLAQGGEVLALAGVVYERPLGIYFTHYLRADKKFAHPRDLVAQIQSDIARAKHLLAC